MAQWLSYSPLDQRFAGSIPAGVNGFFSERKSPEYDFLRKGSIIQFETFQTLISRGSRVVDLWHVKEPQAEIRASEQNLSDFSCSMSEAMLMTYDVKKCRITQQQQQQQQLASTWYTTHLIALYVFVTNCICYSQFSKA